MPNLFSAQPDDQNDDDISHILLTSDVDIENIQRITNNADNMCDKNETEEVTSNFIDWGELLIKLTPEEFKSTANLNVALNINSHMEFVNHFITNEILEFIYKMSIKSLKRHYPKKYHSRTFGLNDLMAFIVCIQYCGIVRIPNIKLIWDKKAKFFYNSEIAEIISYKTFTNINSCLSCISKRDYSGKKISNTPKIINLFNALMKKTYSPGENLCIDEGIIPFKGRSSFKVFNPAKPTKWGLKIYMLAESKTGFLLNMRICSISSTLTDITLEMMNNYKNLGHKLYMDNFYNSFKLCSRFKEIGVQVCGTLRERRGGPKNLKDLKRKCTNSHILLQKHGVNVLVWNDKKPVALISSFHNDEMVQKINKPRNKTNNSKYDFYDSSSCENSLINTQSKTIPKMIKDYNDNMGGVDLFDQLLQYYSPRRKSKRWTNKFTIFILNSLLTNAYTLFKNYGSNTLSHLDFLRLVMSEFSDRVKPKRNQQLNNMHLIVELKSRRDCYFCKKNGIRKATKFICETCRIPLCPGGCFKKFH